VPSPRGRSAPSGNLPFQLTSFVGRERERAEAARLLSGTRLLTLTGAGGVGKTRLALQVAADVAAGYRDGVWLVEFAALSDAALVPQAVAAALRVDEQPGRSILDLVGGYLRSRAVLLLFDNCEHVLTTCASLAEALLRTCRDVRILATSREALGIPGETVWRVPSLGLPDANEPPVPDRLAASESVRLFVERAAASQPGFRLTERNAAAVLQVCRRLDGLPLALELAAARVKGLPVEQIAARLDQGFRLLTDGSRTALPRHQTLRATMDWSYGLLSKAEQAVLRRLAVFGGGFTVESAEAVCADDAGGTIEAGGVLGLLLQLVDKSLVTAEEREGQARYHLLETVRQYADGRLDDAGEAGRVRRRHAAWFLALAERAEAHLHGPEQVAWLRRLEAEHENLRAALESSGADPDGAETALRLGGALWPFWHMRGHFTEGRRSVERALARGAAAPPRVLPKALWCAGHLSWRQGRYDAAVEFNNRNLAVSSDVGDLMGMALGTLGNGLVALHRDDFAAADALFAQATGLFRQTGDRWWIATALNQEAFAAWYLNDRDRAAACIAESLELLKGLGGPWGMAYMLRLTGHVAVARGEYARAASLYGEAFPLCREVGDRWVLNECVTGLGAAASALGRHEEAARLLGATGALEETLGIRVPRSIAMMLDLERRRDSTRANLGSEAFAAAGGEGRVMDQDRLIEYAAAQAATLSRGAKPSTKSAGAGSSVPSPGMDGGPLTAREREVAALVARGLTNREIAARLSIAERTIDAHVQHILNKLGFHSRAQIAAWAAERGLRGPES
jgi:predicted ATPase/DNA-binding CsgD family transcriptional regulator